MFVREDRGSGGAEEGDGSRFVAQAYMYALALGAMLYGSIAAVIVHDRGVWRGGGGEYWAGAIFAEQGPFALAFCLVLFLPGLALYALGRWFESQQ
jgi:hypothetical protein